MSRRTVLATLALLAGLVAWERPAAAQRSGLYDVAGVNMDGTPYTGVAEIRQAGLASFAILWQVGQTRIEGIGMASGRTIAVVYGAQQRPGIGIYNLLPDGKLEGEWTIFGASALGRETLTPRPETSAAPAPATPPAVPTTPPASNAPAPEQRR
jgi:hypothetical protein